MEDHTSGIGWRVDVRRFQRGTRNRNPSSASPARAAHRTHLLVVNVHAAVAIQLAMEAVHLTLKLAGIAIKENAVACVSDYPRHGQDVCALEKRDPCSTYRAPETTRTANIPARLRRIETERLIAEEAGLMLSPWELLYLNCKRGGAQSVERVAFAHTFQRRKKSTRVPCPYLRVLHKNGVALRVHHRRKGLRLPATIAKRGKPQNTSALVRAVGAERGPCGAKSGDRKNVSRRASRGRGGSAHMHPACDSYAAHLC